MKEHKGQTDQVIKIDLPSAIQQVMWAREKAAADAIIGLEIFTHYVGNNSDIQIELSDHSGKKFGSYSEKIHGNHFWTSIKVPADAKDALYAKVKLPKHGLEMQSNPLFILPSIEITNLKWDKEEAREGDVVKLTADIKGAPDGTEAIIEIWEYDADKAHDLISKFPVFIKNGKIDVEWEYEYYEDKDEIPTKEELEKYGKDYNPPEYFFTVTVYEKKAGQQQESGLLTFRDWIKILLTNGPDEPIAAEPYNLYLPDGKIIKGETDSDGMIEEDDILPGKVFIEFPGIFKLTLMEEEAQDDNRGKPSQPLYKPGIQTDITMAESFPISDTKFDENDYWEDEFDFGQEEIEPIEEEDLIDDNAEEYFVDEPEFEHPSHYEVVCKLRVTGTFNHFGILDCISIHLFSVEGGKPNLPISYELKDGDGAILFNGFSEDGVIFHDSVKMGDYELVIGGRSYPISSSVHASDVERVYLFETES